MRFRYLGSNCVSRWFRPRSPLTGRLAFTTRPPSSNAMASTTLSARAAEADFR